MTLLTSFLLGLTLGSGLGVGAGLIVAYKKGVEDEKIADQTDGKLD